MPKKKKVAPIKTVYYSDELNDDFSATKETLDEKKIDERYNYFRLNNIFVKLFANFLYYVIAKPLIWAALKIYFHHKVINKKLMKKRGKNGCFIYGNHTNYLPDAAFNSLLHHKRNYVIVGSQTVNIRGIAALVQDLGAIPLGSTLQAKKNFMECISMKLKENASITIFPEAHIWPYYTKVRPFVKDSFIYPVEKDVPVFSVATCYQKRKKAARPRIIFVVNGPFYRDPTLDKAEAMQKLRDEVYGALNEATKKYSNYEYYSYVKKEEMTDGKE